MRKTMYQWNTDTDLIKFLIKSDIKKKIHDKNGLPFHDPKKKCQQIKFIKKITSHKKLKI